MFRATPWIATLLATVMLVAPSADAQRKKAPARKKPAVTAKPKARPKPPAATKPAPTPAAPETPAESDAAEAEPPTTPSSKPVEAEEKPTPRDEASHEADKDKDKDKSKESPLPPLLDLEIGAKLLQRHLLYKDDVNDVLPDYNLSGAPAVALNVGIYPIRTSGLAIGIVGGFETAFAIGTTYASPQPGQEGTHSSSASAYSLGARANFIFGKSFLGLGVDYGAQSYKVDLPPPTPDNAQVPNTTYAFVRPNLGARIAVSSNFSLLANVGYLFVLSADDLVSDARFVAARTTMSGFDLGAGVGWAPFGGSLQSLELRPMVGWRRFAFTFKPEATDPYQATGANDDFVTFSLLIGLRL